MDDLISRQAAIDAVSVGKELLSRVLDDMDVVGADREKYSWGIGLIESNIEDIKELPSAQPEQKSGKWIYDGVKRICPFCKDFIVTGRSIVKYCWNCGARLKERSKDADS